MPVIRHGRNAQLSTMLATAISSLPDETLDAIFRHAHTRPECYDSVFDGEKLPVPTAHLALRLVSRRLSRIATPHAWQTVYLRTSSKNYHEHGSRRSFRAYDFFSSNPQIARLVLFLVLNPVNYLYGTNDEETDGLVLERISSSIDRLIRATTSLVIFGIEDLYFMSPGSIRHLLSSPSIQLIMSPGVRSLQNWTTSDEVALKDPEYCSLEAFSGDFASSESLRFLTRLMKLKKVSFYAAQQPSHNPPISHWVEHYDLPWLDALEELSLYGGGTSSLGFILHFLTVRFCGSRLGPVTNVCYKEASLKEKMYISARTADRHRIRGSA